jgi:hypothetical protein
MRFRIALSGIIPDGVLVRVSNIVEDQAEAFALNAKFAADLMHAVAPVYRPALVTTAKSRQLAGLT